MPPEFSRNWGRSVLILGSLCLPCYVRHSRVGRGTVKLIWFWSKPIIKSILLRACKNSSFAAWKYIIHTVLYQSIYAIACADEYQYYLLQLNILTILPIGGGAGRGHFRIHARLYHCATAGLNIINYNITFYINQKKREKRPLVAQGHKGVFVTRRLWIRSPLERMNYYFLIRSFPCFGTEAKLGGKWGTERLNTRFPLPTMLYERHSVKLI